MFEGKNFFVFCLSSGFEHQFAEEDFNFKWKRMFLGMHMISRAVVFVGGILCTLMET